MLLSTANVARYIFFSCTKKETLACYWTDFWTLYRRLFSFFLFLIFFHKNKYKDLKALGTQRMFQYTTKRPVLLIRSIYRRTALNAGNRTISQCGHVNFVLVIFDSQIQIAMQLCAMLRISCCHLEFCQSILYFCHVRHLVNLTSIAL